MSWPPPPDSLSYHHLSQGKSLQTDLPTSTSAPPPVVQAAVRVASSECPYDHLFPPSLTPFNGFPLGAKDRPASLDSLPLTSPVWFSPLRAPDILKLLQVCKHAKLFFSEPLHMLFLFTEMPFPLLRPSSNTSLYPHSLVQHLGDFLKKPLLTLPESELNLLFIRSWTSLYFAFP